MNETNRLLEAICTIKKMHPDLRIGQLICSLADESEHFPCDPYNVEDKEMLDLALERLQYAQQRGWIDELPKSLRR